MKIINKFNRFLNGKNINYLRLYMNVNKMLKTVFFCKEVDKIMKI